MIHNTNNNLEESNIRNIQMSDIEFNLKIKEWFIFIKSYWVLIFISCIIGSFVGFAIAFIKKPIYKAELTFAMEEDKGGAGGGGLGGALGLASSFGIDLGGSGGGAFAASNLTELMKSRLIVEKVLLAPVTIKGNKTTLAEYYIIINKLNQSWANNPSLSKIKFLPNSERKSFPLVKDSILKVIHNNLIDKTHLSISQKDKKVTILSIEVKNENELFAKLFCENLAKETSNFYIETKSKKAKINVDVLQKQVDSIKNELNNAISNFATETDNVFNLNPAHNIKGAPTKKKQIDIQANTAILTNLVVQLELAKITLRKDTPLIQLIDSPTLPLEKSKMGKFTSLLIFGIFTIFIVVFSLTLLYIIKINFF